MKIFMRKIENINQLSLPESYKETLLYMIDRLQVFPVVKDIILFGSCAREKITNNSDIDLALTLSKPITIMEEWDIDYSIRNWETMLPCDIIFLPVEALAKEVKGDTIVRPILLEGVLLNGLLSKR